MTQTDLPAAFGFLASAHTGGGSIPAAVFATRGRHTRLSERLRTLSVDAVLVHPDAGPSGAHASDADTLVLFAGEIYNRDEIDDTLDSPANASDAERVSGLFEKYDLHAFRLINGRYAALLVTGTRVLAATDHAGSVPLYVRPDPGHVLAATEVKGLAAAGAAVRGAPVAGARRVRRTPGVHQVPAGAVLDIRVDTGDATVHRTWVPPVHRLLTGENEALNNVRAALERAVVRRLPDGGRPLVVLSGGIDSSAVAALSASVATAGMDTLSMGTDVADEFPQARVVAEHLASRHREFTVDTRDLLALLPHTVYAAESLDPAVIEYLLPLTALYRRIDGPPRRILTGYGADIPLGGMHREDRLPNLDTVVAFDMDTFDGLNEMSPVLSTVAGHWSTHPYWDREVLELLTVLEAGLKRRYGRDKWVLRAAMSDLLPAETVARPKLGVHEGSGTTASFSLLIRQAGAAEDDVAAVKARVVQELFDLTVVGGVDPDEIVVEEIIGKIVAEGRR
ncbi:asparagine synthase-related protein [Streptomyces wedmorensis]|uniref:asparagine synthase (glutamine-hydrolyzing) n=1 Tax=Streptomyces viridochromogenes TaxID=1938 RepID=A0A0L8KPN7_STRVR|nr:MULTISPECIES: asparagine synthase-related protein [Streptomyces]KOG27908.1 carboxyethyl-arginine beta-lactam-synthase [Streptomyces viridochromogenes]